MVLPEYERALQDEGWALFEEQIDPDLLGRLQDDLEHAYEICRGVQLNNGMGEKTDGTVHHILNLAPSFIEFLERQYVAAYLERYFAGKFILNSYGGVINLPSRPSYVHNIHRDVRTWTGSYHLMINMLVMLDDFTAANGATWLLAGSHKQPDAVAPDAFFERARQATGPRGSILLFDSNVWHCAGQNTTSAKRRALTLSFSRPLMKQQMDYPRSLGYDRAEGLSEWLRQVIGFNSRVPVSLDEWYQPVEKRLYKADQG